ncbi:MAG: hypothetical protein ACLFN0_10290 [Thermovirgaceae bacterium]
MIQIARRTILFAGFFAALILFFNHRETGSSLLPWILLVSGFLGYRLVPWPKRQPGSIRYSRFRGVVLPDLLGYGLLTFFFSLGAGVVSEGGPFGAFIGLGAMGFLCLSLNAIAAWYEAYEIQVLPEGILRQTLFGKELLLFGEMTEAGQTRYSMPGWMRWLSAVAVFVNWRATGPLLVQSGRHDPGILIRMEDGKSRTIWGTALPGYSSIYEALRKAGVKRIHDTT